MHGNLLFIGHSSFNRGEFSAVFLLGRRLHVQQVVLQVCRELQRSSVVRALHDWFCTLGNCHIVRTLQTGSVFSQWSQTWKELGIDGDSCQPTDSGSIAIVSLYRTICEWVTFHCVVLPRSWFDFTRRAASSCVPTQGDFLPSCDSDVEVFYQCWVTWQVLLPFSFLLTVLWTKLSTWTVFVATVTLRYNNWSDSAPAYNPGRVYAS